MRKLMQYMVIGLSVGLLSLGAWAESPGWASKLLVPSGTNMSVAIGTGHLLIPDAGNYAYSVESAEWDLSLDAQYRLSSHLALGLSYTRDTIKIQRWAYRHNFARKAPVGHTFNFVDTYVSFPLAKQGRIQIAPMVGLGLVDTPESENMSEFVGMDATYNFTRHLYATVRLKIKHSIYLDRDATFGESALLIGWRF